jgi:AcrR family transcriptional regulator
VAVKPTDRRVQRTRQLLQHALLSLIEEKGFEGLAVQDIIDRANVGRATFYAHFDNKDDLLVSGIETLQASLRDRQRQALSRRTSDDEQVFAFSHELFSHVNEHRKTFRAMVGKRSGVTIQRVFHKMLVDLVREDVKAISSRRDVGAAVNDVAVQLLAGGLFSLVIWWVDGSARLSVDEVNTAFRRFALPVLKALR